MSAARPAAADKTRLTARWLSGQVCRPGGLWTGVDVVDETGSTNEDLLRSARNGAPAGLVLVTHAQTAGRGRRGRSWQSQPGTALMFSVLVRPTMVPQGAMGWLPLLTGVAVATAVRAVTRIPASLKWPNDVTVGEGKLAGILAERVGGAVVVGTGLNVLGRPGALPVPTATSLESHGAAQTDRAELLAEILRQFEHWYLRWTGASTGAGPGTVPGDADASGLRPAYLRLCATVGREVNVRLPGDRSLAGTAVDVDATGRLLVRPEAGDVAAISAGDVVHVR